MKAKVIALAVALAMPVGAAHAATYSFSSSGFSGSSGIMYIDGAILGIETVQISLQVNAVPGPVMLDTNGRIIPAGWTGLFQARTPLSVEISLVGQCVQGGNCFAGGIFIPPSASFALNISDVARTISWLVTFDHPQNIASIASNVTVSLRDGLTLLPAPIPAALPLHHGTAWLAQKA